MRILVNNIFTIALTALLFVSCTKTETDELVIYSGRSRSLVEDLVEDYKQQTDINVEVRYGNDAELLAVLGEEGDQSPADIFWANTTGALANATNEDLLTQLPDSLLQIPESFTSSGGTWIPVTVRFRVMAYNSDNINEEDLPQSVFDLPAMEELQGRVGWTPTYSSFYDFVTAMRIRHGADSTRTWLQQMQEMNPKAYSSNTPMIQAIAAGEIDVALTNHYYVIRMKQSGTEGGSEDEGQAETNIPVETHHFASGDIGNLALVTGASVLNTSDNRDASLDFLRFLLSKQAQEFAIDAVYEYPVIKGVAIPEYMLQDDEAFELSPDYDYEQLRNLEETLDLLRDVGLI